MGAPERLSGRKVPRLDIGVEVVRKAVDTWALTQTREAPERMEALETPCPTHA
jgi:hypothetical protein